MFCPDGRKFGSDQCSPYPSRQAFDRLLQVCFNPLSSLSDTTVPPFLYFPTHLIESQGPKHWARWRILQACERLGIAQDLWPNFDGKGLRLPLPYKATLKTDAAFSLPEFNYLYQTEGDWRQQAKEAFDEFLGTWSDMFRASVNLDLSFGRLTPIPQPRGNTPIERRYDWAAQRHCLKTPFKEMATDQDNADKIRKAVYKIWDEAGIPYKRK